MSTQGEEQTTAPEVVPVVAATEAVNTETEGNQVLQEQPATKEDKYQVQAWAVEPLAQIRSEEKSQAKVIGFKQRGPDNCALLINITEGDKVIHLHVDILEGSILKFSVRNSSNKWEYTVDDVVGPLDLSSDPDTLVDIHEHSDHYSAHINKLVIIRVEKHPFELSVWLHGSDHPFMRAHDLHALGHISLKTHFDSTFLVGIPEHPDHYNLQDTQTDKPYRLYNLDRYLWPIHSKGSLYGTAPIVVSHSEQRTAGFFWRNSSETYVDIRKGEKHAYVNWLSEQGDMEFIVFADRTVTGFYSKLARTVGYSLLPQLSALGYQHSRYSFKDQQDVQDVDEQFDNLTIPYDYIYLDIDHCDQKRYFSFNKELYPDVDLMIRRIEGKGRKISTIVDPHVLIDEGYYVYAQSKDKQDYFVKQPDQADFEGTCWPGPCKWLDFVNPEVRKYWASLYSYENYKHSTTNFATWNDMNEPAVFKGIEETMSKDNIHTIKTKLRKYQVPHSLVHNLYGYSQVQASFDGLIDRDPENKQKRPLILTRSWWVGTQKHAAIWTADSEAKWDYFDITTPMLLSFSSVGLPFCGADVGGFEGNPTEELHVRWYQAGAFQPFFRAHSSTFCDRREPWLFSTETCQNIRKAIRTRYEFLPVWYSEFFRHQRTGMPVMRALWQNYPYRYDLFQEEQIFMIGSDILVAPVVAENQREVKLCEMEGRWYDYNNNFEMIQLTADTVVQAPLDTIPVYFRGSSITLLYDVVKSEKYYKSSDDLKKNCPLKLVVCLNQLGAAEGEFYMDDGSSLKSERNGEYSRTTFVYSNGVLAVDVENKYGESYWPTKIEEIHICGLKEIPTELTANMTVQGSTLIINNANVSLNHQANYTLIEYPPVPQEEGQEIVPENNIENEDQEQEGEAEEEEVAGGLREKELDFNEVNEDEQVIDDDEL